MVRTARAADAYRFRPSRRRFRSVPSPVTTLHGNRLRNKHIKVSPNVEHGYAQRVWWSPARADRAVHPVWNVRPAAGVFAARRRFRCGRGDHRRHSCGDAIGPLELHAARAKLPRSDRRLRSGRAETQRRPERQSARPAACRRARCPIQGHGHDGAAALHPGAAEGPDRNRLHADDVRVGDVQDLRAQAQCDRGRAAATQRRHHSGQDQYGGVCGRGLRLRLRGLPQCL
jgi:hypothetical protein